MKNVRIIPAKPKENKKLRVAAYCRVSTSGPEQLRSLEIQISAYTKMIKSNDYNEDYICKYISPEVAEKSTHNHQMSIIENLNDDEMPVMEK